MQIRKFLYPAIGTSFLASLIISCAGLIPVTVAVHSVEPAKIHIGKSPNVGLVKVSGSRRNLQDVLAESLVNQSRRKGFYVISNRIGEGIRFDIQDDRPVLTGKTIELGDNDHLLSAIIVETNVYTDTKQVKKRIKGADGKTTTVKVDVPYSIAEAIVGYSLVSNDRVYMFEREYAGKHEVKKSKAPSRDEMLEAAVTNSAKNFLKEVTASNITSKVKIDNSDKNQKAITQVIKKGNIEEARIMLEKYVESHPNSAPGYYNLAVLTEATGKYEEAEVIYDKAISLGGKDYYVTSKAGCMERRANKKLLEGE